MSGSKQYGGIGSLNPCLRAKALERHCKIYSELVKLEIASHCTASRIFSFAKICTKSREYLGTQRIAQLRNVSCEGHVTPCRANLESL